MDFSSYSMVANTDYSPSNDSYTEYFDKAYFADAYITQPGHSLSTFLDCDSFLDQPVRSVELPTGFAPKSQEVFNATLPAAANANVNSYWLPPFSLAPLGHLQCGQGFASGAVQKESFEASCVSPMQSSPTPSLCGDGPQTCRPSSPELSPRSQKCETPSSHTSPELDSEPKRPRRKRGRPRLDQKLDSPSVASTRCQRTIRIPHNQVERKYREGLNAELERLRRAVPTLLQSHEGSVMGQRKPGKAMVLACAIDYIKKIEQERDMLQDENDILSGISKENGSSPRRQGWEKRQADPVSRFVVVS